MVLQIVIKKKLYYCKENLFKSVLINFFFENYKMFYYDNFVIVCINVSFMSKGVLLSVILFLVIIN